MDTTMNEFAAEVRRRVRGYRDLMKRSEVLGAKLELAWEGVLDQAAAHGEQFVATARKLDDNDSASMMPLVEQLADAAAALIIAIDLRADS